MDDDELPGIRWRFPHQCAHWFGMTVLFDARSFLDKFQFVFFPRETDMRIFIMPWDAGSGCLSVSPRWSGLYYITTAEKSYLKRRGPDRFFILTLPGSSPLHGKRQLRHNTRLPSGGETERKQMKCVFIHFFRIPFISRDSLTNTHIFR